MISKRFNNSFLLLACLLACGLNLVIASRLMLVRPNAQDQWVRDGPVTIAWRWTGTIPPPPRATLKISLYRTRGKLPDHLGFSKLVQTFDMAVPLEVGSLTTHLHPSVEAVPSAYFVKIQVNESGVLGLGKIQDKSPIISVYPNHPPPNHPPPPPPPICPPGPPCVN